MRLWHYTCRHSVVGIRRDGELRGNTHPLLPDVGPLVHLTDLDSPDRYGLGLTSEILRCDRTEYRIEVDADATHWPVFARRVPRATRERFEGCPGILPMHWYVTPGPVPVLSISCLIPVETDWRAGVDVR